MPNDVLKHAKQIVRQSQEWRLSFVPALKSTLSLQTFFLILIIRPQAVACITKNTHYYTKKIANRAHNDALSFVVIEWKDPRKLVLKQSH